jgi:hypothetical protein
MFRLAKARSRSLLLKIATALLLLAPTLLLSQTLSGTIQDSSGAVIANARIEISAADFPQPLVLSSNAVGQFESPQLKPGTYSVRVTRDGFEPLVKTVEFQTSMQLQFTLEVAQQQVTISVPGKSLAFLNSDPIYRELRKIGLGKTFRIDNFTLTCDAAKFHFDKGTLKLRHYRGAMKP